MLCVKRLVQKRVVLQTAVSAMRSEGLNIIMKISFWSIGKVHEAYAKEGIEEFTKRLSKYFTVQWNIIAPPKNAANLSETDLKIREAELVLNLLKEGDYLVALDERGKDFTSEDLAKFIQQRANESTKNLVFLIGGAYGLDEKVLKAAKQQWSLSKLTFPHQLVRLILAEQVYRACTILQNEKYHHG
ncbi:23S rRNA (pseudouridine(1915)-N(3))-methyltransferase RlmH [Flavisolibacter ginsenosidimutans]